MKNVLNIYTDDNLPHYVIINKEHIDYLNLYIILFISKF